MSSSDFPPSGSQPPFGQPAGPNAYQAPNNPYSDPQNPYGGPPQKSRWWLWLLLGGGGMALLVCCGCAGFMWFAFNVANEGIKKQLNEDPVVAEHLGEVEGVSINFIAAAEETEKQKSEEGIMVWDVDGSKADGKVIGRMMPQPDGSQRVEEGILRMPTGEEYPLSE